MTILDDLIFLFIVLALLFLFAGDPDVWDKLHERVMTTAECKP